jgi:hypothetical protein
MRGYEEAVARIKAAAQRCARLERLGRNNKELRSEERNTYALVSLVSQFRGEEACDLMHISDAAREFEVVYLALAVFETSLNASKLAALSVTDYHVLTLFLG